MLNMKPNIQRNQDREQLLVYRSMHFCGKYTIECSVQSLHTLRSII